MGREIVAGIVDVAAEPVAGAVHVERPVGLRVDDGVDIADHVPVEQAGVEHALGEHPHGSGVRIAVACAGMHRLESRSLRVDDDLVERALRRREAAVGGEGAGDVAGVAVEFAAGIDQAEFARHAAGCWPAA